MRQKRNKRSYRALAIFFGKCVALVVILYALSLLYQFAFNIRTIICQTNKGNCPTSITTYLQNFTGQKLQQINPPAISQHITTTFPEFSQAKVGKKLPGTLELLLTQAQDIAQLYESSTSAVLIVSDSYHITKVIGQPEQNLSLISVYQLPLLKPGDTLDNKRFQQAITLASLLKTRFIDLDTIHVATDSTQVQLRNQQLVLFNESSNQEKQLLALQLILANNLEEPIKTIDLRYDKPIIVFDEE